MGKVIWAFDRAPAGETFHVRPAQFCKRVSPSTVTCPTRVHLTTGATLYGYLRVHRTRQGLLGVLLPWDPEDVADTLGQAAGSESVVDAVHVSVEQP
jgi:hypothetical protein